MTFAKKVRVDGAIVETTCQAGDLFNLAELAEMEFQSNPDAAIIESIKFKDGSLSRVQVKDKRGMVLLQFKKLSD